MTHTLHLHADAFQQVKSGSKTVEGRIYDEKRRRLQFGDDILLMSIETDEEFVCEITGISLFSSFLDMFKEIKPALFGFEIGDTPESAAEHMRKYYSEDEERNYGVVGIHLSLLDA